MRNKHGLNRRLRSLKMIYEMVKREPFARLAHKTRVEQVHDRRTTGQAREGNRVWYRGWCRGLAECAYRVVIELTQSWNPFNKLTQGSGLMTPEKWPNMHLINIDPQASPVRALPQDHRLAEGEREGERGRDAYHEHLCNSRACCPTWSNQVLAMATGIKPI